MSERDDRTATEEADRRTTMTDPPEGPALTTADMAARAERPDAQPRDPSSDGDDDMQHRDRLPAGVDTGGTAEPDAGTTTPPAGGMTSQTGSGTISEAPPLFAEGEAAGFRDRWNETQTGFVDEPRRAVEQADGLVAEMMQRLAQVFAEERSRLEQDWDRGDDVSTEDLRIALRRYRSFFERLLAA